MEESEFENRICADAQVAKAHIESVFKTQFPEFVFVNKYDEPTGHWAIQFKKDQIEISIGSGRGFLKYSLKEAGKEIPLVELYPELAQLEASSEKNIAFLLSRVMDYFRNTGLSPLG